MTDKLSVLKPYARPRARGYQLSDRTPVPKEELSGALHGSEDCGEDDQNVSVKLYSWVDMLILMIIIFHSHILVEILGHLRGVNEEEQDLDDYEGYRDPSHTCEAVDEEDDQDANQKDGR